MNLESDKRLNIQLRLDFSSTPTGEARQALREDIESLSVVHESERPANTRRIILSKRVSVTSRTAVYGPVRTVVWEGRSREAPPYPDLWHKCEVTLAPHNVRVRGQSGKHMLVLSSSQFDPYRKWSVHRSSPGDVDLGGREQSSFQPRPLALAGQGPTMV